MNDQRKMAILMNDLDSMVHRIEDLPAHPELTNAQTAISQAKANVNIARAALHQRDLNKRYD